MKCINTLVKFFIILSAIFLPVSLFAQPKPGKTYHYYMKSLLGNHYHAQKFQGTAEANLGFGYSTDRDTPIEACIMPGTVTYGGSAEGVVDVARNYSLQEIKQQLHLSTSGDVSYGIFKGDASADFVHDSETDDYSESFIYRTNIQLKNSIYNAPPTGDILNRIGQTYQNDGDKFRYFCGDKYIDQMYWGGELYLEVKMNFHDTSDKQSFDASASGSVKNIADFSAKLSEAVSKINKNGSITIRGLQIGGDPTKLGKILGGGAGTAPITECSFDHLDKCQAMLSSVITYASSTTDDNFPTQIKTGGSEMPISAAQMGFHTLDYAFLGVPIAAPSKLTPEIKSARQRLAQQQTQNITDINRVNFLLNYGDGDDDYNQKLDHALTLLLQNKVMINDAGQVCFTDLDHCVVNQQQTAKELNQIDRDLLLGPHTQIFKQVTADLGSSGSTTFPASIALTGFNRKGAKTAKVVAVKNATASDLDCERATGFGYLCYYYITQPSLSVTSSPSNPIDPTGSAALNFSVQFPYPASGGGVIQNPDPRMTADIVVETSP